MFRKMFVTAALIAVAASALALPRPSEVKAAVNAGDYVRAETMLKEVMAERPTATVHYQLGQVYAMEGKHSEALNELRQAQALDPTLKFAGSADKFMKVLQTEQEIISPQHWSYRGERKPAEQVAASKPAEHSNAGLIVALAFGVLIFLALIHVLYTRYQAKKEIDDARKKREAEKIADAKEKTNDLLVYAKQLEDATLITKTATYSDDDKAKILARIVALQTQTRNLLATIKDDGPDGTQYRIAAVETNVNEIVDQATNGLPKPAPFVERVIPEAPPAPQARRVRDDKKPAKPPKAAPASWPPARQAAPAQTVVHHYHNSPAHVVQPAPVIVQTGGSDILTGIMIGEALSNHSSRDRDYENERQRERERAEERAEERRQEEADRHARREEREREREEERRDTYEAPSRSSFDSGSSSDDSYSSSDSSSGSFDSGSSSSSSDSW